MLSTKYIIVSSMASIGFAMILYSKYDSVIQRKKINDMHQVALKNLSKVMVDDEPLIKKKKAIIKLSLMGLSGNLWSKDRKQKSNIEIPLHKLSRGLWGKDKKHTETIIEIPQFKDPDIITFYEEVIKKDTAFEKSILIIVLTLLEMLDKHSELPSVVVHKDDPDTIYKDLHHLLKNVSLVKHTLNVTYQILMKDKDSFSRWKWVIAALAHDIGKIDAFNEQNYSKKNHPNLSNNRLTSIPEFNELPVKKEISRAILNHHNNDNTDPLTIRLKDADYEARSIEKVEMERIYKDQLLKKGIEEKDIMPPQAITPEKKPEETNTNSGENDSNAQNNNKLPDIDISWIALDTLKSEITNMVNNTDHSGANYCFSMPDGIVYLTIPGMLRVLKKMSINAAPKHTINDKDKQRNQRILQTLIQKLRESDILQSDLVGEGFYSASFDIHYSDKRTESADLIPLQHNHFGDLVLLESRKKGKLSLYTNVEFKRRGASNG